MTIKDIEKAFRIEMNVGDNVSLEAVRQFVRVMNNIYEQKKIYRVVSLSGKESYHATMSDIVKYLIKKGFATAQIQNIHMAVQSGSKAYSHHIDCIILPVPTVVGTI